MKKFLLYVRLYWNMLLKKLGWKKGDDDGDFIY